MLVVVNKHNTARVASRWFIIYYRIVMHGNSNIKISGYSQRMLLKRDLLGSYTLKDKKPVLTF